MLADVAFESATVQFTVPGAVTVEGVHVIDCKDAGATSVRLALTVLPFHVADTFAMESLLNVPVFAVKVAEEAPAEIVTDAGTLN